VDWTSVLELAVGAFVGTVAGWGITHYYARRSSQELRREAESLRRLTTLILRGLEEAGLVEFSRDEQGRFIGISFKRSVLDAIGVADDVEVTLEGVMNSIRNGLGMRETEIAREPSRPWNPHFYAISAQVHNTL
jgi:hypothetical protein